MKAPRPRARLRSTSPIQRVQAALVLWVFLVGNLAALTHAVTSTHRRCPEHGELVDDEGAPGAEAVQAPPATRLASLDDGRGQVSGAVRSVPAESAGHHSHCFLGCISHQQSAQSAGPSLVPAPGLPLERSSPAPAPSVAHGPELYRTAPKTSPPAA